MRRLLEARITANAEEGSAIVEFTALVVVVVVPLALLGTVLVSLHRASLATVTAAREATRAFVTADSSSAASVRARQAASLALADQGLVVDSVRVRCLDGTCLAPGTRVRVTVSAHVQVPFVPGNKQTSVPVSGVHEAVVDTFRSGA